MRRSELIFLLLLITLTVSVRLAVLEESHWMTEGDEALTGLMALDILEGDLAFLNGQSYMGAYQAYAAAALFAMFGVSTVALKLVPLLGSVGFVLSTYALSRRLSGSWGACAAGLVAAIPPMYVLANMAKAWAPHSEVMAIGNLLILMAIRHRCREATGVEPLVFGALAGFAFWLHPFVAYYLVVCALIVLFCQPWWMLRRVPAVVLGGFLGIAPICMVNVADASEAVRYLTTPATRHQDVEAIASYFVHSGAPLVLGWRQPWGTMPSGTVGTLIVITVAGLIVLLVQGRRTTGWIVAPADAPILLAASVPLLFVFSGFGGPSQNPQGFDATGRYLLPLWGVVPLAVGGLAQLLARFVRPAALTLVALVVGAHVPGYVSADPAQIFQSPYWDRLPEETTVLAGYLQDHGLDRVWMNHWAGFPLMLETHEQVIATDYYDVVVGGGINRFPEHFQAMTAADRTAYVLVTEESDPPLLAELYDLGVNYRSVQLGPFLVVQPLSRLVEPWEVVSSLDYRY